MGRPLLLLLLLLGITPLLAHLDPFSNFKSKEEAQEGFRQIELALAQHKVGLRGRECNVCVPRARMATPRPVGGAFLLLYRSRSLMRAARAGHPGMGDGRPTTAEGPRAGCPPVCRAACASGACTRSGSAATACPSPPLRWVAAQGPPARAAGGGRPPPVGLSALRAAAVLPVMKKGCSF